MSEKPGWVRMSIHPTMTTAELDFILHAIAETVANVYEWEKDYLYDKHTNEFRHRKGDATMTAARSEWFDLDNY